jgi:hypothetical protein
MPGNKKTHQAIAKTSFAHARIARNDISWPYRRPNRNRASDFKVFIRRRLCLR